MKTERSSDADYVNSIIARHSKDARTTGKILAVLVIVLSLLLPGRKASLMLGMAHIGLEYYYSITITILYKFILRKYFDPIEDGFALKDGANPSEVSHMIAEYGSAQMIVNGLILILAIICLI